MDQPPSSWLSFFFIEFPPSPHQATLSYSLILPVKCPGTSVHIKVGFSSCWTRFPIALVYCWLKSVLTILTSVWLRLSLTPSYPVLPSMLASTSSPLNCLPRPPHLLPCPHTHRIFPLRSCLVPTHLHCLLHSIHPLPVLGRLLFLTSCITWMWCFSLGK